jgi:futalosine hydrolase
MKILIVFATQNEAGILHKISGAGKGDRFNFEGHEIYTIITGVGGISTAWGLKLWLDNNHLPDLAINAGIAGSYNENIRPGDVVLPVTDCFADMGIEEKDKTLTLFEAGLSDPDQFPFSNGIIRCDNIYLNKIEPVSKKVKAVTVNTCSGSADTIERIRRKFNPDIETMEGATFFYICTRERIPFLSVRSISNIVELRNRSSWDIPLALANMAEKLSEILLILD